MASTRLYQQGSRLEMATKEQRPREKGKAALPMAMGFKYASDKNLSEFAAKSENCKGRLKPISSDPVRTPYERDYHRVLYSWAFRRLKHKTQVFYAPQNDHICTRMDHSLQVASIADTICRRLKLNVDLANAIALGHDLGHAPFGHTGEEVLNRLCVEKGLGRFMHEANSLRVADRMGELHGETLNLTHEVRAGIVCHCREQHEQPLKPQREKDVTLVDVDAARVQRPYTLEGCVVRYADRVAYLAADLQDALELKIIRKRDIPSKVRKHLGADSGEITGRVTQDIITISSGTDYIATSVDIFSCLEELSRFSEECIYNSDVTARQRPHAKRRIRDLFEEFLETCLNTNRGINKRLKTQYQMESYNAFFEFLHRMKYDYNDSPEQIVLDYVSGMTDNFVLQSYDDIFPIRTPVRAY